MEKGIIQHTLYDVPITYLANASSKWSIQGRFPYGLIIYSENVYDMKSQSHI